MLSLTYFLCFKTDIHNVRCWVLPTMALTNETTGRNTYLFPNKVNICQHIPNVNDRICMYKEKNTLCTRQSKARRYDGGELARGMCDERATKAMKPSFMYLSPMVLHLVLTSPEHLPTRVETSRMVSLSQWVWTSWFTIGFPGVNGSRG